MDPIGITPPIVISTPVQAISVPAGQSMPIIPSPTPAPVQADPDAQAMEQAHYQAVQQMAQSVANVYVVSDQKFTIFKDATGQYITRYTSLRDGKVTYVPEPALFKLSGASGSAPLLKIQA